MERKSANLQGPRKAKKKEREKRIGTGGKKQSGWMGTELIGRTRTRRAESA